MKQYALITDEPLTPFEDAVLRMLHDVAETGYTPRSMMCVVLPEHGDAITYYHNATLEDMMLAKSYLELDMVHDTILANLPYYVERAEKEGLIEFDDDRPEWEEEEET